MKTFLILFFAIATSAVSAEPDTNSSSPYDQMCPTNEVKLKSAPPPVLDQKSMNWCTTFACAAGLSYHARKQNPQLPENFVFSPLDLNNIYDDGRINLKKHISLNMGGNVPDLLGSVQKHDAPVKSDKGEPFPFTEQDKDLEKLVVDYEKKLEEYLAENPNANVNLDFDIQPPHKGPNDAYTISKAVAHSRASSKEKGVSVARESIELGDRIPASPYPDNYPLEARTSFSTQMLLGSKDEESYKRYFEKLSEVIQNDSPVFLSTCASQLEKFRYQRDNTPLSKYWEDTLKTDPCGSHQMLAVGVKRDESGKCVVVLQNSWGSDWADEGLVEIPFSEIVKFDSFNSHPSTKLVWLDDAPDGNKNNTLFFADRSEYTGPTKGVDPTEGEGRIKDYQLDFLDGSKMNYTGEVKVENTTGGYRMLRHGKGSSTGDNGLFQRGEYANGQFVSGRTKIELNDKSIFDGEFQGGRPTNGTITFHDGKTANVRNGFIYTRGSPSMRPSIGAQESAVVPTTSETTP